MHEATVIERDSSSHFTPNPVEIERSCRTLPVGKMRQLMIGAQDGDPLAYREFLRSACDVLEEFYHCRLTALERGRAIDHAMIEIHEKRATCPIDKSARSWVVAISEYRRREPACKKRSIASQIRPMAAV